MRYLAPGRSLFDFVRHPSRLAAALRMARKGMEARAEFVGTSAGTGAGDALLLSDIQGGPYRGWQIDLAFGLLDRLGPGGLPLDYERVPAEAAQRMPLLRWIRDPQSLESVAMYREYQFDWPERVCIDAVLDAERLGAVVRNYTEARIVSRDTDGWSLEIAHADVPAPAAAELPVRVQAKVVLNMAGIWIDDVNRAALPRARQRILGTKGCHIVVKLPADCANIGIATLNSKLEPFYCIPYRGYHFFGPTETVYEGDKDRIRVTAEERAWLVGEANRLLPQLRLAESDVLMTWAGVRPLTYDENVPFGNRSRVIHDLASDGLPGVYAMTAGPVMTHRSAGRELTGVISRRIPPSRPRSNPDYTPTRFPDEQDSAPLLPDASVKLSDLRHAVRAQHARTLMDALYRRVGLGWRCAFTPYELTRAADVIGGELGWSEARKQQEIQAFQAEAALLFDPRPPLRPLD
ncbi:MAG: FAD-dependent oxidoreductase [Betaproteobacteria bacterium]|nr:FAD-dependent oxidoreductase [Betaproteobacteria bacterium]